MSTNILLVSSFVLISYFQYKIEKKKFINIDESDNENPYSKWCLRIVTIASAVAIIFTFRRMANANISNKLNGYLVACVILFMIGIVSPLTYILRTEDLKKKSLGILRNIIFCDYSG